MDAVEHLLCTLPARHQQLWTWAQAHVQQLMEGEALRIIDEALRSLDAAVEEEPDATCAALALRAQYQQGATPHAALESVVTGTLRAWAAGQHQDAAMERFWHERRRGGEYLTRSLNHICAAAWCANQPEVVTSMNRLWQAAAQAAHDDGVGIWSAPSWGIALEAARGAVADVPADNAAAVTLFRAGCAYLNEAKREATDAALAALHLPETLPRDVPELGWMFVAPRGPHAWRTLTRALLFGIEGQERLALAQEQLNCAPAAVEHRVAYYSRWMGRRHLLHPDDFTGCYRDRAELRTALRAALRFPAARACGEQDVAGRELLLPVDGDLLRALIAEYDNHPACEGLRLLTSLPVPHPDDPRGVAPRVYLALTLSHTDHLQGARRVSFVLFPRWCTERTRPEALALARAIEQPIVGEGTWDDTTSWYGAREASSCPAVDVAELHPDCTHLQRDWDDADGLVVRAHCRRCGLMLIRMPVWRLEDVHLDDDADEGDDLYLSQARWWAALAGEELATVPDTLAQLQERDGVVPRNPPPQRAPRRTTATSLRAALRRI